MSKCFFWSFILLIACSNLFSQHVPSKERGKPAARLHSSLESNNIRTTIFNNGITGRQNGDFPISEQTPYEWPKGTGQVYLALTSLLVGAEVNDENGNIQKILMSSDFRSSPQGNSWNFEPVPGYYNTSNSSQYHKIASSKYPETWPEYWPDKQNDNSDPGWEGSWNGYLGKNKFINGEELYYKMSDDLYDRYNYYPDSTDTTRGGLGLLVDCRAFQFDEIPFLDMVFYSYKIKNDGTKPLNKMGLTLWVADFVGGNGDSNDDIVNYDTTNNIAWFYDADGRAPEFGENRVGLFSVSYLKTPLSINSGKELGITNIQKIAAGGLNINSDLTMWNDFMVPGKFFSPFPVISGEYDNFISSSYFNLMPGESEELITAIIFRGYDEIPFYNNISFQDIAEKHLVAKAMSNSGFKEGSFNIELVNDPSGNTFSNEIELSWNLEGPEGKTRSFIYHSSDYGITWNIIGIDSIGANEITWDTQNTHDGVLNKFAVYSFDDNGYKGIITNTFTINNSNEDAPPQIIIINPKENEKVSGEYEVKWIGGDAEGGNTLIELFYKSTINGSAEKIFSTTETEGTYQWNSAGYANSNHAILKAVISTGAETVEYQTPRFEVYNERTILGNGNIDIVENLHATGWIEYHIADSTKLTGHTYLLEFDQIPPDENLVYNIYDYSTGTQLLYNIEITDSTTEGPIFNGLRLIIKNDPYKMIESKSGWNSEEIIPFIFEKFAAGSVVGEYDREDYQLIISDEIIDTSKNISIDENIFGAASVYFTVKSLITGENLPFGFIELDTSTGSGNFSISGAKRDRIIMLKKEKSTPVFTNWIYLDAGFDSEFRQPEAGDTLNIYQTYPFLAGDSLFFSTGIVNSSENNELIKNYELTQNYPNPFNPTTQISFSIPQTELVKLVVYDILGREVKTLLNTKMNPGKYAVKFNGGRLSSGVYIYRLTSGEFRQSKKMVLVK